MHLSEVGQAIGYSSGSEKGFADSALGIRGYSSVMATSKFTLFLFFCKLNEQSFTKNNRGTS